MSIVRKTAKLVIIFLALMFFPAGAQDSTETSFNDGLWRSVVLPGWGQIYQDRLWAGCAFYSSAAAFYYNGVYKLDRYRKSANEKYLDQSYQNFGIAAAIHALSIGEFIWTTNRKNPRGWQGGLLSDKPLKSPWGAALRTAILPGWGQAYNESYFKAGIYAGINGFLVYKIFEAKYDFMKTGEPHFRDRRSRYSWYFGAAYLLTIAEAYAGAYLYKFDEAMKLTIQPDVDPEYTGLVLYVRF